jgi:hypothetical protein
MGVAMGSPIAGWFTMENPIKMDIYGYPYRQFDIAMDNHHFEKVNHRTKWPLDSLLNCKIQ